MSSRGRQKQYFVHKLCILMDIKLWRSTLMGSTKKPHAVCIPFPAQGHVTPMLNLAKLLHRRGFHITFVNTEFMHSRLLKSSGGDSFNRLDSFQFDTIPDGLPAGSDHLDVTQSLTMLCDSISKNCLVPFRKLVTRLNNEGVGVPPVSCIVSDGIMSFTLDVAEELGIPEVLFWTPSACGFKGYLHVHQLIQMGLVPLKDPSDLTNGFLDNVVKDWIPGMNSIRLRDLPTFIRTTNRQDIMLNFRLRECERAKRATAIVMNTFDALENQVIQSISASLPPIYSIGPLNLLVQQIPDNELDSIRSNLWIEETECLQWLNKKKPKSVVYVNFGSMTVMTNHQLIEFAWGLANSKQELLWVIRPDIVSGDAAVLPSEFIEDTKQRSLLCSWVPQDKVLGHGAIGGFLTHSGWNSTMESICEGVPMICWPFFAEQQMNSRYCCNEWGIGMEIGSDAKRDEIEKVVRELMEGEKGKEMRGKVKELKNFAEEAIGDGGSSSLNLDKLINDHLLKI